MFKMWRIEMIHGILMIIIGIMLFIAGIMDIRSMKISRKYILVLIMVCIVSALTRERIDIFGVVGGILIGLCIMGISMISDGHIGRGDGLVIGALGIALGFRGCLIAVCIASLIMCIVSVVILILKRGNKNTKLPYVPALFVGYLAYMSIVSA